MGPGGSPMGPGGPQVAYVWHLRGLRGPKCHTYATCGPSGPRNGGSPRAPEVPQWAPEAPQVAYVWHLRALRAPKCHTYLGAFPALRLPRPRVFKYI